LRGDAVDENLAAVAGRHHARSAVQRGAEVVLAAHFGLAGCDTHSHRQLQRVLRGDRGVDGRPWRLECRTYPVTGVLEQPTVMRRNGVPHDLVVSDQRPPHRISIRLPPTGRTLDIGE
jgi:hypothetical protein